MFAISSVDGSIGFTTAVSCRFTLAIAVQLPDVLAREDIITTHLRQHCREHVLGVNAVEESLSNVSPSCVWSLQTILGLLTVQEYLQIDGCVVLCCVTEL